MARTPKYCGGILKSATPIMCNNSLYKMLLVMLGINQFQKVLKGV